MKKTPFYGISDEAYEALNQEITSYISSVDRGKLLLAETSEKKDEEQNKKL